MGALPLSVHIHTLLATEVAMESKKSIWISTVSPYPSVNTDQHVWYPGLPAGGVGKGDVRGIPGDLCPGQTAQACEAGPNARAC